MKISKNSFKKIGLVTSFFLVALVEGVFAQGNAVAKSFQDMQQVLWIVDCILVFIGSVMLYHKFTEGEPLQPTLLR